MRAVITGGPANEPIDEVRTITNRSTGELAVILANVFREAGHQVELFLGETSAVRLNNAKFFSTNENLQSLLLDITERTAVSLVLHAAALSDFAVSHIETAGQPRSAKISSDSTRVALRLVQKPKVIGSLPALFPSASIIGWKLELDGGREALVERANRQIRENKTHACVINGRAFGPGFGFCRRGKLERVFATKIKLARFLVKEFGRD
jgi:phosphopantothenoylcysteine synthetase/decarboxylase